MFYFPILNITFAFRAELMEIPLKLILLQETEDRSTKNYSLLTTLFVAPSLFLLIPSHNLITFVLNFVFFFLKKRQWTHISKRLLNFHHNWSENISKCRHSHLCCNCMRKCLCDCFWYMSYLEYYSTVRIFVGYYPFYRASCHLWSRLEKILTHTRPTLPPPPLAFFCAGGNAGPRYVFSWLMLSYFSLIHLFSDLDSVKLMTSLLKKHLLSCMCVNCWNT